MSSNPLQHAITFWKPLMGAQELDSLARYGDPGAAPSRGITAWRVDSDPKPYQVRCGATRFALFAAVHPIDEVPSAAEVLADIVDPSGRHHSYVLWHPGEHGVTMPFDPNAAIEAFWREEYVPAASKTVLPQPVLSSYYKVFRRLIPTGVRVRLRKLLRRRVEDAERFLEWPSDDSLDLLQRFLLSLVMRATGRQELQFAWFWPDRHPWAVALTHDVETAGGLARVLHVAEIERARGLRSSFNLVPLDYEIPGSLLEQMRAAGLEIGVHGYTHDGMLFSKWSTFLERIVTINECGRQWGASGFRSPATYRNQEWFHLLGFEYDSSVADTAPFEPQPGGCASFFPFQIGEMVELPITLPQDHTLFGLLGEDDAQTWLTKIELVRASHGMACVLAHPDPSAGYIGLAENEAHYRALLDVVAESGAWTPLPRDLARWWRARAHAAPAATAGGEGGSLGTAVLQSSGRLELVAPERDY